MPAIKLGRIQISSDAAIMAVLLIMAAFALGQCGGQVSGADAERDRLNAENSRRALQAYRAQRAATDRWADSVAKVSAEWNKERRLSERRQRIADSAVSEARSVLSDAAASRTALQQALRQSLAAYDVVSADLSAMRRQADSLAAIVSVFPAHLAAERQAADSVISRQRVEIAELRDRASCHIASVIPCPTRVQSFLAGAGSILVLLVFGL